MKTVLDDLNTEVVIPIDAHLLGAFGLKDLGTPICDMRARLLTLRTREYYGCSFRRRRLIAVLKDWPFHPQLEQQLPEDPDLSMLLGIKEAFIFKGSDNRLSSNDRLAAYYLRMAAHLGNWRSMLWYALYLQRMGELMESREWFLSASQFLRYNG